jgi:hypothetical protein
MGHPCALSPACWFWSVSSSRSWSTFSISYAVSGQISLGAAPLEGMHTVFAIDLSLMVPAMALRSPAVEAQAVGVRDGRGHEIFGFVYQLNLAAAGWFQADAGVENVRRIDPVGASSS